MNFEATITQIIAGIGGATGVFIIIGTSYHNYRMREYAERQAVALERVAGGKK